MCTSSESAGIKNKPLVVCAILQLYTALVKSIKHLYFFYLSRILLSYCFLFYCLFVLVIIHKFKEFLKG